MFSVDKLYFFKDMFFKRLWSWVGWILGCRISRYGVRIALSKLTWKFRFMFNIIGLPEVLHQNIEDEGSWTTAWGYLPSLSILAPSIVSQVLHTSKSENFFHMSFGSNHVHIISMAHRGAGSGEMPGQPQTWLLVLFLNLKALVLEAWFSGSDDNLVPRWSLQSNENL